MAKVVSHTHSRSQSFACQRDSQRHGRPRRPSYVSRRRQPRAALPTGPPGRYTNGCTIAETPDASAYGSREAALSHQATPSEFRNWCWTSYPGLRFVRSSRRNTLGYDNTTSAGFLFQAYGSPPTLLGGTNDGASWLMFNRGLKLAFRPTICHDSNHSGGKCGKDERITRIV